METLTLMIIDDSEMNNLMTTKVAKKNNRIGEVSCFTNSQKALDQIIADAEAGEKLPDLIFLDIHMPEMDGYEWIDEIDEVFEDFSSTIVLVSGTNQQKDFESLNKQRLAKELISKPLTEEVIDRIVRENFS